MKSSKLLEKLNKLIGVGEDADKKEIKKLRKVLKALKEKQDKLEASLEEAEGEHERRKIMQQLEVIRHQRHKGVKVYQSIKQARDS